MINHRELKSGPLCTPDASNTPSTSTAVKPKNSLHPVLLQFLLHNAIQMGPLWWRGLGRRNIYGPPYEDRSVFEACGIASIHSHEFAMITPRQPSRGATVCRTLLDVTTGETPSALTIKVKQTHRPRLFVRTRGQVPPPYLPVVRLRIQDHGHEDTK